MTDITAIVENFREFNDQLRPVTKESVGRDMFYCKLVKNIREVEKFNYHSDYWGCAEYYQDKHIEFMIKIKPYIDKTITLDGMTGKLLGLLIDTQYNSLEHSALLLEIE